MKKLMLLIALIMVTMSFHSEANDDLDQDLIDTCKNLKNQRSLRTSQKRKWAYCSFERRIRAEEATSVVEACENLGKEAIFKPKMGGEIQVECGTFKK